MSIASEIQALVANKIAIKNAILAKSPTTPPGDNLSDWPTSIESIPSGGGDSSKPIKFRDYDGVVLHSYTVDEVASMTELPPLPTKSGLICQEWNWTLQQIKDYVAAYGKCEVGATYTTDDGKTRIKLTIQDPKYATIPIVFKQTVINAVKVNWGDGSADQTYSGTPQQTISHTYAPAAYPATYIITFEVVSGTMSFPTHIMGISTQSTTSPRSAFLNMIDEVNIGNSVTSIGDEAFYYCYSLASITIPNSVTSIGSSAFQYCYSLVSTTIPSSVTSIGNNAFQNCFSLVSTTIPSSATSIGSNIFQNCYSLASITIPSSVTSTMSNTFTGCYSLASITIPSSVTSIGNNAFQNCFSLVSILSLSSVTSIGTNAFQNCYGLKTFDFRRNISVPTLSNVNAFVNTPTVKEIVVPDDLYDTWIAASNWSSSTNQIKESIVKASESSLGPLN